MSEPTAEISAASTGAPSSDKPVESAAVAAADLPEPQNALTQKFTEAEWKALKELRAELPSVVEAAYGENKPSVIKLWDIAIDPNGTPDARASVALMKFLRARDLVVANAKTMLISTLKWRVEFKADDLVNEQFPEDVFGNLGHIFGKDKEGRPVTYNLYGGNQDLKAVFGDLQRFLRWRVSLMEKGVALLDFENVDQMVQVHDYEGVGLSSRDANSKRAAKEATTIFQDYYPEFLARKFFINVPSFFTWIFWLFKPLMSAQTLAKMSVVGTGSSVISKELLAIIDKSELPTRYGGDAKAF